MRPVPLTLEVGCPAWVAEVADPERPHPDDAGRMRLAIRLARENVLREQGGPFGAAVFESAGGRLVAAGVNSVLRLRNSVLHAEVVAIMLAQRRVGSYTLAGPALPAHELVTSCAPCAMCLGAALWSGVRRIVCGATREDVMAFGFEEGPVFAESFAYLAARGIAVEQGVLRDEARAVIELYAARGGVIYNG